MRLELDKQNSPADSPHSETDALNELTAPKVSAQLKSDIEATQLNTLDDSNLVLTSYSVLREREQVRPTASKYSADRPIDEVIRL